MKKQIYGVSSKYEFGAWHHNIIKFENRDDAKKWLEIQEDDFRERELMSKSEAVKLVGKKRVDNACLYR